MADVKDAEKRRRAKIRRSTKPPLIATIAGVLATAFLGLWWLGRADPVSPDPQLTEGTRTTGISDPVADYREFASALDSATTTSAQLVEGLRTLGGAVGVATAGEAPAAIDLRIAAEHIALNPDDHSTTTAVRNSLVSAADALDDKAFASAADSIDPHSTIEAQRTAIVTALQRAAAALLER